MLVFILFFCLIIYLGDYPLSVEESFLILFNDHVVFHYVPVLLFI